MPDVECVGVWGLWSSEHFKILVAALTDVPSKTCKCISEICSMLNCWPQWIDYKQSCTAGPAPVQLLPGITVLDWIMVRSSIHMGNCAKAIKETMDSGEARTCAPVPFSFFKTKFVHDPFATFA